MTEWHMKSVRERDEIVRQYTEQGAKTFVAGGTLKECPYRDDTQEAIWWRRGFQNALMGTQLANQR